MNPLPPGPETFKLIDFLHSGFISAEPFFRRLAAEHGPTFRVKTLNGPLTITGDPEVVRAVYTADPDDFDVWGAQLTEPIFGVTSIVVTAGARHRRDRRLLTPPFNAGAMRAYGEAIAEISLDVASRWRPGRSFSMLAATQSIALDVIIRVVFGVRGEARVGRTREAVLRLIHSLSSSYLLIPALRRDFGGFGPWARNQRAAKALEALLVEEIQRRRDAGDTSQDILGLMVSARYDDGGAMSEIEIADQLRALLFAGHETTAVALAWAMYWLHREPAVLARVRDEIDALGPAPEPADLAALPYLEAVCLETLRMYPPVVDTGRVVKRPFQVKGYTIPAGEAISASPLLLHRREDIYPSPERFRPARFLDRKFSPFEFIAFGGGARRCLGAAFAMYEMKVILGTLLGRYGLRLESPAPLQHVRRGVTMGPSGRVPMILEGERQRRAADTDSRAAADRHGDAAPEAHGSGAAPQATAAARCPFGFA
ncbi:cytochrome P450 [Sorangium cellulosum]|uniref:Cytochrome P450 n=1 Tax=Sorangium cellulosum TaxID=56 RepID=A0A2L0F3L3_SORCE|nr:cytochrome P450 [Sorangium cellulosum]AUX46150.1 cytochrome P450 [Sorangium cellulosum]